MAPRFGLFVIALMGASCAGGPQPRADEPVQVVVESAPTPSGAIAVSDNPLAPPPSSVRSEPAPARSSAPEDRAAARDRFKEGVVAYSEGRYGDARRAFERAYALAPMPAVLYNLAMADQQDGDTQSACAHFELWKTLANPDPHQLANMQKVFLLCPGNTP